MKLRNSKTTLLSLALVAAFCGGAVLDANAARRGEQKKEEDDPFGSREEKKNTNLSDRLKKNHFKPAFTTTGWRCIAQAGGMLWMPGNEADVHARCRLG